ncbi:hypothetical protein Leryth_020520 [Lithospermum erythrorhizon]|nr:hypothetical protein Leryth_020520 [Lithospermum erythrorhizon]
MHRYIHHKLANTLSLTHTPYIFIEETYYMKKINWFLLFLLFSCATLVWASEPSTSGDRKSYIVYLGEKLSGVLPTAALHTTMLSAILGSNASKSILHNYKNFNGFVVKLTEEERKKIAGE